MASGSANVEARVAGCVAAQVSLVEHLQALDGVVSSQPSRLAGWTVGHVLTHVARNADSYRSLLLGRAQYEGGWDQRNAEIDDGAGRGWQALVDDVDSSSAKLAAVFGEISDWDRPVHMLMGAQPARVLPNARQREVEVHRVDLGLGYEFDQVPTDFVGRDLELLRRWWASTPHGTSELPSPVASAPRREQWLWLLGRVDFDGVEPARLL